MHIPDSWLESYRGELCKWWNWKYTMGGRQASMTVRVREPREPCSHGTAISYPCPLVELQECEGWRTILPQKQPSWGLGKVPTAGECPPLLPISWLVGRGWEFSHWVSWQLIPGQAYQGASALPPTFSIPKKKWIAFQVRLGERRSSS